MHVGVLSARLAAVAVLARAQTAHGLGEAPEIQRPHVANVEERRLPPWLPTTTLMDLAGPVCRDAQRPSEPSISPRIAAPWMSQTSRRPSLIAYFDEPWLWQVAGSPARPSHDPSPADPADREDARCSAVALSSSSQSRRARTAARASLPDAAVAERPREPQEDP